MISIIVPIYNAERYIDECLNSLINQTYKNIEIILINDGSKDSSDAICKQFVNLDHRIKYFSQPNGGVSSARNHGLQMSYGEYIMFVDSDDLLPVNALELMYNAAKDGKIEMVVGSYEERYPSKVNKVVFENNIIVGEADIAQYISKNYLSAIASSPCMKLYKRDILKNIFFDQSMSLGEDLYFNLHCFRQTNEMVVLSDCCYIYRISEDYSLTKSYKDSYYSSMRKIYQYTEKYFENVEKENDELIERSYSSYKLFSFGLAFAVRQIEKNYSSSAIKEYLRELCNDQLMISAIRRLKNIRISEKIMVSLMKYKMVNILYLAIYYRAKSR